MTWKQPPSVHPTRNNVVGMTKKGLVNQTAKRDSAESNNVEHLIEFSLRYIDRFLATKTGTPEARIALDNWTADERAKRK